MFTFRKFTLLFFLCLFTLNFWSILTGPGHGGFIREYSAALYGLVFTLYFGVSVAMAFLPCSGFHHSVRCSGETLRQSVSITFDDGPDPLRTPNILQILNEQNIRATFFCIGSKLEGCEGLLRQMVSEGHIVGNHSLSHSNWFDLFSAGRMRNELEETNLRIEKITGHRPALFRPPYGVINPMVSNAIKRSGMLPVCWSIRSFDTLEGQAEKTIRRICRKLRPGAVILLHDHSTFCEHHLRDLITSIRKRGFEFEPLDQLLKIQAYETSA
jgi:peptidoglycan/xylan/chitin deacetylase (PgdA/CDA1 family)